MRFLNEHAGKIEAQPTAEVADLERLPYTCNHGIEKESLKFKEVQHVKLEKVAQLFKDML